MMCNFFSGAIFFHSDGHFACSHSSVDRIVHEKICEIDILLGGQGDYLVHFTDDLFLL